LADFQNRGIGEIPMPITTEGGDPLQVTAPSTNPVFSEDFRMLNMMGEILQELRLMNKHLEEITGEEFVCGEY